MASVDSKCSEFKICLARLKPIKKSGSSEKYGVLVRLTELHNNLFLLEIGHLFFT
jgi:hypothetical protein